jgi:hypothetical protein
MLFVFLSFLGLSIVGYMIERGTMGDIQRQSKLVEAVEDGRPDKISIEAKKKRWALVIYSFSVTRNFKEIFLRPNRSIKDKKFEVFNGLRFVMSCWIMLGHCYLLGSQYGNSNPQTKMQVLSWFFTQLVISSDFALSFFYFMSGFIVMFALIKKYQKGVLD